ncbi:hypothetical protein HK103_000121 [Boothiomyces macroporosus]|uniref:Uncharacterized protein n=1 Tax=Boothiomyces macroporosus TaxID=261099 RepID=A0AAD5UQI7_9FUNG|nr:hypothetical protein HK103_000121 [Boothiomyces macroporosus]
MDAATLVLYGISCFYELLALLFLIDVRRKMQPVLWRLATVSTICILVGFSLSLFSFVTTNAPNDCVINMKLSYSIRYIGFLAFDISQARKFIRVYSNNSKVKIMVIHGALVIRFASYVYNAIFVSGEVAFASDNAIGIGPCQTVFQPYMIYQEHAISVLYELVLVFILALYALQQSTKDNFMFSDLLKKIMDFEMSCFAFYLLTEVVFIFVYALSPKNLVSVFNIFYLQIPVVLFFATTLNILRRKGGSYDSGTNQSEGKLHASNTVKSRVTTVNASKDVPSIFSAKENIDVPNMFGKPDTHANMPKSVYVKEFRNK